MKMMHGAALRACSNRSRTRAAPMPTNISTNSDPDMEKNGTFASPATARASSVLPVPWRANEQNALGQPYTEAAVRLRIPQEGDDLLKLELGFLDARDV